MPAAIRLTDEETELLNQVLADVAAIREKLDDADAPTAKTRSTDGPVSCGASLTYGGPCLQQRVTHPLRRSI